MIRALIVDDSIAVRSSIADRLRTAGMDVVGEAADGGEGVILTHRLKPDVVLMDVVMPEVDGLVATRQIMAEVPTPVVILSAYSSQREVFKTYDALAAGALEVCAKPVTGGAGGEKAWDNILRTVRAAAQVSVVRLLPLVKGPRRLPPESPQPLATNLSDRHSKIIVMGASTGGPVAVCEILRNLAADFPLPILLALHGSGQLSSSVTGWFAGQCSLTVRDAVDAEPVPDRPGTVIVAPPHRNLTVSGGRIVLADAHHDTGCTPSIDKLFTSAACSYGRAAIGVLLTGMGADGAEGLNRIRLRGGCTIAQDEASCIVFGMPGAAIKLGAVEHVMPLRQIPQLLTRLAASSRRVSQSPGAYS